MQYLYFCTEKNDVYTWGWKECVPSSKVVANFASGGSVEGDAFRKESVLTDQGNGSSLSRLYQLRVWLVQLHVYPW